MNTERETLAAEYVALIGYDPFEDDPTITVDDVRRILDEYKAERAASLPNEKAMEAFGTRGWEWFSFLGEDHEGAFVTYDDDRRYFVLVTDAETGFAPHDQTKRFTVKLCRDHDADVINQSDHTLSDMSLSSAASLLTIAASHMLNNA